MTKPVTTAPWTILLALIIAFLAAAGQLFLKWGAGALSISAGNLWRVFLNWHLLVGLVLYGLGFVLLVIALRHGNLSIVYSVLATSYVWVALLSATFLGEPFERGQWLGLALVLGGIYLIVR